MENQAKFRNNIIDFVKEHELDGIDLDWEYPEVSTTFISFAAASYTAAAAFV